MYRNNNVLRENVSTEQCVSRADTKSVLSANKSCPAVCLSTEQYADVGLSAAYRAMLNRVSSAGYSRAGKLNKILVRFQYVTEVS